ncbi:hypothetical protein HF325_004740 [Metschnikowia pulcherrima]|uniref:Protein kinase domain-containing protein n=1 Tax=Metschnikowia pulcherrima TaxID=27326 RepID=A0A8H7GR33_9ASCO|nr:hypothetical protein HF325_004740 [Metschnikowia pulcherrima]
MSDPTQIQEYVLDEVVDTELSQTLRMFVREYKKIGEGAFGTVVEAVLAHMDGSVPSATKLGPFAIKRVLAQTEYKCRELEILRAVKHPNVSRADGKVYQNLVMECLPLNLQSEIKYYRHSKYTIPYPHMKAYTFQLARAMLYLHGINISHRDIKPLNILIDPSAVRLKICDFGSAKQLEPNQPSVSYICSRYYRAPELIVGCTVYTTKIDIWGLGCVIAEMFLGKPIFQGQLLEMQLKEISKLLGPPPKTFFFKSNPQYRGNMFSTKLFSGTIPERFERIFSNSPPDVIDLLLKVLVYDPEARASAKSILLHPFFDELKLDSFKVYPRGALEPIRLVLHDLSEYELGLLGPLRDEFLKPKSVRVQ